MRKDYPLDRLIDLVRSLEVLEAPQVEPVAITLRSGMTFALRDPSRRGVPAERQETIQKGVDEHWLLGRFLTEWGFDVPHRRIARFHRWLESHESDIVACQPDSVSYRGTYAVVLGGDRTSGSYRTLWTFSSFAGMQDFGYELSKPHSSFAKLVAELVAFRDHHRDAALTNRLLQPAQGSLHLSTLASHYAPGPQPRRKR